FTALTRLAKEDRSVVDMLRIHFVGDLSGQELRAATPLIELGMVKVHGLLPRPRAIGFQRAATMLLLVTAAGRTSMATGKLFEYLRAGRPVLGLTHTTVAEKIILAAGVGFVVDPNDADGIRTLLRRLVLE